ncbi:YheC/YheD family protein [Cohnella zeiphila]|uniref:YheC/YheD family protein n=1 Tax=Cohnella zeiphila TaxID=2761120 RepID=A0A7X0SP04_9BACL|nr:YheC/YheD family protein [Cohnella zeiphila]MBB6733527.1 YheC/YheD family protein [Cohnella zeiphila]
MTTALPSADQVVVQEAAVREKPVLAILTIDDDVQFFRGNRPNFADLIATGEQLGYTAYVVTVRHLNLNRPKVLGFTYYAKEDAWVRSYFPRPDIIYNRIPQREDERLPRVRKKLIAISRQPDIQMFNRRFFNKWSLFRWLSASKLTRPFIPETKQLTSSAVLSGMLKRHPMLYLKPVRGKAGVGIMSVRVQPEKHLPYRLLIQEEKGSRTYQCSSLYRLWERVEKQSKANGEPYIAQQGIALASVNDRPFDLRTLVQKNQAGQWELTGIGARVAGSRSITTHVPRGGSIDEPEKLLVSVFGQEKARRVLQNVRSSSLVLARRIERASKHKLGEMSMDLGVDGSGHLWFFEANSKPMKFDEPHIRRKSLEQIFHYSGYLFRKQRQAARGGAQP